ncbi:MULTISPECIES: ATP-binding protein [Pseudomonas]|uniref:ATP-binding protein n=1 Tax=Pseudomonas TaxID=286 RepID=UPI0002A28E05|nr:MULTISPECIES: ATP-binding protein [Pseudomonas]AMO74442.1 hypothetical protein PcP3B5_09550 [Pseudomonas citronellolis]NTX89057.1 ATP-binding protein [Pseudomonas sp. UMA643]NTY17745.1 ATP-binding protein [Pseudomonas sp. UMC3103]NTY25025.1 ATP-binding protein [Pseudomonas sp. UMA603]NTY30443.1 ATP-binding protein [Pseudomonas sp. UMC3129]
MWESLGFRESPYNTDPLKSRKEDVELLVGREKESIEFCTQLETDRKGVLILSGAPGVGKTSFFNVQQYLLESQEAIIGPHALASRKLCPIQPGDDVRTIAVRALDSLHKSIEEWCRIKGQLIPTETKKIGKWLTGANTGFDFGIQIFGNGGNIGRSVDLPSLADASFESIVNAIEALASEAAATLGFECSIITLDNLENLKEDQLKAMLISFRDTLFSIPNLWWVLIGQSGLGSLIQSLDPRVFERTTGSGIEITPIELDELNSAISARVKKFHKSQNGTAPLTIDTHKMLFEASYGEMRFVFKYSNSICTKFVEKIRQVVLEKNKTANRRALNEYLDQAIGKQMINDQIDHSLCVSYLRQIVESEIKGLSLKPKEKIVLHQIGEKGKARPSEFKDFNFRTLQDFSSNYLTKLYGMNLLVREQEGKAVNYRLRGIARLGHSYGLFTEKAGK